MEPKVIERARVTSDEFHMVEGFVEIDENGNVSVTDKNGKRTYTNLNRCNVQEI